jgi:hypothetical protein
VKRRDWTASDIVDDMGFWIPRLGWRVLLGELCVAGVGGVCESISRKVFVR